MYDEMALLSAKIIDAGGCMSVVVPDIKGSMLV
jgi:hypothetical protein